MSTDNRTRNRAAEISAGLVSKKRGNESPTPGSVQAGLFQSEGPRSPPSRAKGPTEDQLIGIGLWKPGRMDFKAEPAWV